MTLSIVFAISEGQKVVLAVPILGDTKEAPPPAEVDPSRFWKYTSYERSLSNTNKWISNAWRDDFSEAGH